LDSHCPGVAGQRRYCPRALPEYGGEPHYNVITTGFVPFIGAVIGAVPALLLALTISGSALLWTGLLFIVVQQVESNMITPLMEKRLVSLPPALMVFGVIAVGMAFGLAGVLLAAPLTVVTFVLVKKLYVRQTLGHSTDIRPSETNSAADYKRRPVDP
jgi:predicted PurR-regulated permease PerM